MPSVVEVEFGRPPTGLAPREDHVTVVDGLGQIAIARQAAILLTQELLDVGDERGHVDLPRVKLALVAPMTTPLNAGQYRDRGHRHVSSHGACIAAYMSAQPVIRQMPLTGCSGPILIPRSARTRSGRRGSPHN